MRQFHPLRVAEVKRETPEAVSIQFDVPQELAPVFQYTPGQHLTLKTEIGGQEVRRSYSICSGAHEGLLRIAVKKIPEGVFSGHANEGLKAGDVIEVYPPTGRFSVEIDPEATRSYVAFAAGSGITPVLSILKTVLAHEPKSRFLLVYGNRSPSSIMFMEELAALKDRYMGRLEVLHVLSQGQSDIPLFNGRIDAEKVQAILKHLIDPKAIDYAFVCGPNAMIDTVEATLAKAGVEKKRILTERFLAPDAACATPAARPAMATGAQVTVIIDDQAVSFPDDGTRAILDGALEAGAPVPFACKGGVCCTCRAKVLEGEVEMAINYNLEEDEVAAGYVLTCQSFPKTERVVLSFDA
ncbi:1,2-phenylacetyl-CoA epoxidase subunit PaaE [Pedomonas mirosovicensis]|uniref:1,2-phenylacetyl-CoA epoxidase subunit PaaE n=1 Tax=Pedomonas mirosovicensis TaxID=2908641 RepID=UPI00216993E4|nr:1,2-phenylacetyl-CoA epoxidase subunit PaaE [Pedomonas mirosovicensis]MCH8684510.1 phenylacetate-CoA oxygenase/reductase subunit PaaK [Pedomonas mirosovicensis]